MKKISFVLVIAAGLMVLGCSGAGSTEVTPEAASAARAKVKAAQGPPPGMPSPRR